MLLHVLGYEFVPITGIATDAGCYDVAPSLREGQTRPIGVPRHCPSQVARQLTPTIPVGEAAIASKWQTLMGRDGPWEVFERRRSEGGPSR